MNILKRRALSSSYDIDTKLLNVQSQIQTEESTANPLNISNYAYAYSTVEAVGRGVDLLVDLASEVNFDIKHKINTVGAVAVTDTRLNKILNIVPNADEDMSVFRRNIIMDLVLAGNAFIYFDGAHLYRLPVDKVAVHAGKKVKVQYYEYITDGTKYKPSEIIHISDNSANSGLIGASRLAAARNSITSLYGMLEFQQNFFKNGAVPGLILTTPNILGKTVKERLIAYWTKFYNPKTGGRRPIILDGDFNIKTIGSSTFKELDFEPSVASHQEKILVALGVPPILLQGGNNANIRPNMQLMYYTTIIPIMKKIRAAFEAFFGRDLELDVSKVASLQPELQQQSSYYTSLVNTGVITVNEAREALRMEKLDDPEADVIRIPANIAGSAANPSEGGRPPNDAGKT